MFKKGDVVRIKDTAAGDWPNTIAIHGWVYVVVWIDPHYTYTDARSLATGRICGFFPEGLEKADVQER